MTAQMRLDTAGHECLYAFGACLLVPEGLKLGAEQDLLLMADCDFFLSDSPLFHPPGTSAFAYTSTRSQRCFQSAQHPAV